MPQEIADLYRAKIKETIESKSCKDLTPDMLNALARSINTYNRLLETVQMNGAKPGIADEDPNLHGDPAYIDRLHAECQNRLPKRKSKQ